MSSGHRHSGRSAHASTYRGRFGMRYRVLAVVAAAIALSVVAATTAKSSKAAGHTLTVWLQVDAQNGWPEIVAAANHAFENSHPGWNVSVRVPAVERPSAEVRRHDRRQRHAGRHRDGQHRHDRSTWPPASSRTSASTRGRSTTRQNWLAGLKASSTYGGKLYGVPYYAGSRVITYRADLFKKAGFKKPPKSLSQFQRRARQGREDEQARQGVLTALCRRRGLVHGAQLSSSTTAARSRKLSTESGSGRWHSKKSLAGLKRFKAFFRATQSKIGGPRR